MLKYEEYLQSEHWKITRLRILQRDDFKCRICGNRYDQLHVHHNTYKNLGHEQDEDLVTLCAFCHAKAHNKLSEGEKLYDALINQVLNIFRRKGHLLGSRDLKQPIDFSISYHDLENRKAQIPGEIRAIEARRTTEGRKAKMRALLQEKMWICEQMELRNNPH